MKNRFSLEQKNILITGASSGIGQGIAVGCAEMGAQVLITGRDETRLEETLSLAKGMQAIAADLLQQEDIDRLTENLPPLDGVVLCAGMNKKEPVNFISEESFSTIMNTNFSANVWLLKALLKRKKIKKGGSIVIISSISVDRPAPGNAIYAASKGAIDSYMKVLALELSKKGIRVNAIEPGMVRTPWLEKSVTTAEEFAKDEARYPLGRYGTADDIASAAIFLLSGASDWMTGSAIRIDGGISLV